MRLDIKVVPGSSRSAVKKENGVLKVYLTKPAHDGEANVQLIRVLAEYLGIKKYQLEIIKGHTSRNKVVQIDDDANPGIKK
ncbi:MAG: DUF167 domain-containing protein [Candidatus Omnitrophica bacterium]|jgi:hypothetical protein|nr:DUF167 domain-containing protein [Candidatus Omnitrophota bacterium]